MAEKPPAGPVIVITAKTSGKVKTYIWMPDKNGNLIKAEASIIKKSFSILPVASQIALTEYLLVIQNKQPTDAARQTLWNEIVDGAV